MTRSTPQLARRRGTAAGLEALLGLLDAEREAILKGRLDDLDQIARRKEALISRLTRNPEALRENPNLLPMLKRNHRLLEAALQGLAEAKTRIGRPAALLSNMEIYGPSGQKTRICSGDEQTIYRKF